MMDRQAIETALTDHGNVVAHAARALGLHPATLAYQVKRLGLLPPRPPVIRGQHHLAEIHAADLEKLRAEARTVVNTYLPGPARAEHLRALEFRQRALQSQLRLLLGDAAHTDTRLPVNVCGHMRPRWDEYR
jgi:hypothetical protein